MEELFRVQPGVVDTEVGYTGGSIDNPTYESHAGHAEALKVSYDPAVTSVETLLRYFFRIHDPTTLNRQGNDIGTAYRSVIFYANETEKQLEENVVREVEGSGFWPAPIVTAIEPLVKFWAAEDYHQDYLQKNPGGYTCHYER